MVDKNFCMSSYLAFRYIEKKNIDFCTKYQYNHPRLLDDNERILVYSSEDIHLNIMRQLEEIQERYQKIGILLSGGMDSAILASYLPGCHAYTFRFMDGEYQKEELERAEFYAHYYGLKLHYVDISWDAVVSKLDHNMIMKGGPVHSIEPQIVLGALQAKSDGVDLMIIGDGSDYVFGGMDQLLSQDWKFDAFVKRYMYVDPFDVLVNPVSVQYLFEQYRKGEYIDFIRFLNVVATEESYGSYANAFFTAGLDYYDPYEHLKMAQPLDLTRIRSGESKYLIRNLFKMRYPDLTVPSKVPMPRPVDQYFESWEGTKRPEFKRNLNIRSFTGNQKWQIWCLERFLNISE